MKYTYSKLKDFKLREQRGIGFEEIINYIDKGFLLDRLIHHNPKQYPGQEFIIVNIKNYVWVVPCEQRKNDVHLMTAYKSRKYTKLYLGKTNE
jgi:hypothetical protein